MTISAIADDWVTIALPSLKATQIAKVSVNGKAEPTPNVPRLTSGSLDKSGKATVEFTLDHLTPPAKIGVVATGMKGTEATGPQTLATVTVSN